MWGVIPAAGSGTRIQPLAFSKELLPVGSRFDGRVERPRAVSEYLVERMLLAGVERICFVISPGKSDILEYYGAGFGGASFCYVVQPEPRGLCDAIFRALPVIDDEAPVAIGLPDTVWFPEDALARLPRDELSFLLFPVDEPHLFDSVQTDAEGWIQRIQVKDPRPQSRWVWGAFQMPGRTLRALHALWLQPERHDEYIGTLVNAYLALGLRARGVRAGESYVDVGTVHGYRQAMQLLTGLPARGPAPTTSRVHAARLAAE
jgi:dTDP-glucose pyrophosphorylase